jgi:SAM-dependent methyltransferase
MHGRDDQATSQEACLICGSERLKALPKYAHVHLARCQECGFTFARRRPGDGELADYYRHYGTSWYDSPITRERYAELLGDFDAYRRTNRILDLGCGAGFFLEEARKRGWDVYGTEFSARALELNRSKQFEVVPGPITRETFEQGSFDVITAFEVVEHLRDPATEADAVAHALRAGGLLYCTTPNFNAASRRILGPRWIVIEYPEHLCYFTGATLKRWLGGFGFVPTQLTTTGFSATNLRKSMGSGAAPPPLGETGDEQLRAAVERSRALGLAKDAANGILSALGAGDTIKAHFELRR